jgi:UDP-2,3-diacylglucosamine hydrolase
MLRLEGTVRVISDLHLHASGDAVTAQITARFERFIDDCLAQPIAALIILGDLFEYWIGDDALDDAFNAHICARLRSASQAGIALYFVHGNRDFLIGERMAQACGMTLLPDFAQVSAGNTAILLMHGDTLCTDDTDYLNFRHMVRSPAWQAQFLARPLPDRLADVATMRARSREAMRDKAVEIMDANPDAVQSALRESGCTCLIHGHTHRPSHDVYALGDQVNERWVLSDWAQARGDALEITAAGIKRLSWAA